MASSGSVNFDLTRNEIINDAFFHAGIYESGESPAAADSARAARELNRMTKTWQAAGVRLWTRREAILFTAKSQARYKLGPNTAEHAAELDDAVFTELAADAASGASSLTVDSITGIADADNIGIVLDDDTIQWTTVSGSPSGTTVTLAAALTGAAATDNAVFAYTTKINRPLRVLECQRRSTDEIDIPMFGMSHQEYQALPNKTITGLTNSFYYQPEIPDGFIHLWPEPESAKQRIRMTCVFPIEDFDASADNPDLPQEWLDCLTWNLGHRLAMSYGSPERTIARCGEMAGMLYTTMAAWDTEPESTMFAPDYSGFG